MTMQNGFILVKPIFAEPKSGNALVNPYTETYIGSAGSYTEHPFRALVIYSPEFWYNGGVQYKSDIKDGDIVFLPGEVASNTGFIILEGVEYPAIRYQQVYAHYTPTEEERKGLKFKAEVKEETRKAILTPTKGEA